jgi:cytoskeletal protein CcmA (bactofilin family)
MWKRDEAAKPGGPTTQPTPAPAPAAAPVTPAAPLGAAEAARPQPITSVDTHRSGLEKTVNIGKSVIIKGELNGSEDLTIEGLVEGKIELRQNVLTIGPNGKIKAQVFAKSVIILGEVTGNVTATEKVDIRDNGSVDGDIAAPRVAIAEGAHFRGSIDMQRTGAKPGDAKSGDKPGENKSSDAKAEQKPATTTPAAAPQPTPAAASR